LRVRRDRHRYKSNKQDEQRILWFHGFPRVRQVSSQTQTISANDWYSTDSL
jgi:hypothetical protein